MGRWRFTDHCSVRFLCRAVLLFVIAACLPSAMARQAAPMSPSVVLVLKLVSSTLVKPTTGIVVSNDGMVLVPAGFAAEEGEMIVLDGGTDIAGNGRPAKLVASAGDLAVLSVKGLKRPGIGLAGNFMDTAGSLHLEAFPPAGEIARGAPPLSLPAEFVSDPQTGEYVIAAETPLPYVTGAILDECGGLAGIRLAAGPQSLDSDRAVPVLFGTELKRVLDSMQITLTPAHCERQVKKAVAPVAASDKAHDPTDAGIPGEPAAKPEQGNTDASEAPEPEGTAAAEPPRPESVSTTAEAATVTTAAEPPGVWKEIPAWLLLLAVVVMGVIAWKGAYIFRLSRQLPAKPGRSEAAGGVQPASDEPDTAPLEDADDGIALKPRSAPVMDFEIPETASRPDGCNGLLLAEGFLDTDTPFKRFCFVDTGEIDVVIGRGDADIAIEDAAISRNHARIRSDGERLTFSDLGSRNGSFIGDVPCLAGEVMYLEADDEIFLGDVKITISVVKQAAEWA